MLREICDLWVNDETNRKESKSDEKTKENIYFHAPVYDSANNAL